MTRSNVTITITRRAVLGVAALFAVSLTACGDDGGASGGSTAQTLGAVQTSGAASASGVTLLDPAGSAKLLEAEAAITVIDVRTPSEFAAGHLAEAINIDLNGPTFATEIAALDKSATYFVYCQTGRRSALATQAMSDMGFTRIYELDDGITAWLAAGRPVVTS